MLDLENKVSLKSMPKNKASKNATVPVKLPLTHSMGRSRTEHCLSHQISVPALVSFFQHDAEKKFKVEFQSYLWRGKCLPDFSVDI